MTLLRLKLLNTALPLQTIIQSIAEHVSALNGVDFISQSIFQLDVRLTYVVALPRVVLLLILLRRIALTALSLQVEHLLRHLFSVPCNDGLADLVFHIYLLQLPLGHVSFLQLLNAFVH